MRDMLTACYIYCLESIKTKLSLDDSMKLTVCMKSSCLSMILSTWPNVQLGSARPGCLSSKGSGSVLKYTSVCCSTIYTHKYCYHLVTIQTLYPKEVYFCLLYFLLKYITFILVIAILIFQSSDHRVTAST